MTDNNNTLKRLHGVLLEILIEFDRICRKHNIQYFLDSGTALGAVRHGGFIPWDDDIDVGMLRSEYDRFMEIAPEELSSLFYLQSREVDANYNKYHAKLRRRHTIFPEEGTDSFEERGIFIDIFPFDYISNNSVVANIELRLNIRFQRLLRIKKGGRYCNTLGKRLIGLLFVWCPASLLERLYYKFQRWHNVHPTNRVTSYLYKMQYKRKITFPAKSIFPSKTCIFAGREFQIMNDANDYLTHMYSDYMALPPKEQRVYHFDGQIVFDEGEIDEE